MNDQQTEPETTTYLNDSTPKRLRRNIIWGALSGSVVVALLVGLYALIGPSLGRDLDAGASLDAVNGAASIPVRLQKTVTMHGVQVTIMKSTLSKGGSYLYTLEGSLTARDDIRSMKMRIELVDGTGRVVSSDTFNPLDEQKGPMTPGTWVTFTEQQQGAPSVREVRLGIEAIEKDGVISENIR